MIIYLYFIKLIYFALYKILLLYYWYFTYENIKNKVLFRHIRYVYIVLNKFIYKGMAGQDLEI